MFTGLIESTGTVLALRQTTGAMRLIIAAPELAGRWKIGDSIAVNGVCLTAVDMHASEDPHPGPLRRRPRRRNPPPHLALRPAPRLHRQP